MKQVTAKQNRIIRLIPGLLLAAVLTCLVSGCTMPTTNNTTVTIDETGKLTEEIVESQEDSEFTAEELEAYVEEALAVYNRGKEAPAITLDSCRVENKNVRLILSYANYADYAAFNQVTCFQGTLKEAEDAGYSMDMTWLEPNGQEGDLEIIRERLKEWKVMIVSEPINVKVPDKILYASENVDISGRLTATVKTVLVEDNQKAAKAEETASSEEGQKSVNKAERIHPLATVMERLAYIIYK
ncbi:MAG: hypothetical protein IKE31_09375 [Eubacterium sp.]|nr:hypothetical protein [Eubacterium sp.]